MVLVPTTVTDGKGRLWTNLGRDNFQIYEDGGLQDISELEAKDAPASIGILLDLSGSMTSKLNPARESILRFIKASNPQDDYFVVGFDEQPELIADFTSSVDEIQAHLATVHAAHRTALLDAIYYGIVKMKGARHRRKILLVISDGVDNRSHYSDREVHSEVRKSDIEIYSMTIFDPFVVETPEARVGPLLLNELSEETGGRMFRIDDLTEMGNIAEGISTELRNQYMIGYTPKDLRRDGKWRKVKVKLNPPQGLPTLTVHARTGYYAPLQ